VFDVTQLPVEAAYLYDAVWIYATAAHQVVEQGFDPADGRRILEHIRGTTYQSETETVFADVQIARIYVDGV